MYALVLSTCSKLDSGVTGVVLDVVEVTSSVTSADNGALLTNCEAAVSNTTNNTASNPIVYSSYYSQIKLTSSINNFTELFTDATSANVECIYRLMHGGHRISALVNERYVHIGDEILLIK